MRQLIFHISLSGTRDGFAPQTFWSCCRNYAGAVMVLKVKEQMKSLEATIL